MLGLEKNLDKKKRQRKRKKEEKERGKWDTSRDPEKSVDEAEKL